jgi:ABC-type multidrug transport system ATPase subunit
MLLLTLAGRAKPTSGSLTVAGERQRSKIRQLTAVARVTSAIELEPELHVIDHIREAELLTHGDCRTAARTLDLDIDPTALVADLPPDEAVLLSVALAMTNRPLAIVVDDVDIAATPAQQHRIWTALAKTGTAVIASTVDGQIAAEAGATLYTTDEENDTDASA